MKILFQGESVTEPKIQYYFCINTVVTIIEEYLTCQREYTFFWVTLYIACQISESIVLNLAVRKTAIGH
jgi:hypothetical protein